ncbi:MAG: hypothetical protein ACJ739_02185 [Acidimicrobiales bacterium]
MTWLRAHRVDVALVALVLALSAPVVQEMRAQQASRIALTAAIWDDGSLRIDDYRLGLDRAERDGHVYSDKAPGQPMFAIPAYATYRLLGGEPARDFRVEGNLGLWATTIWSSVLPLAILLLLVRRVADEAAPGKGVLVAVLTYVATLLFPFSTVLFGHALSACLAFAGWYAIRHRHRSNAALVASGALFGAAVLVEYTVALAALVTGALLLWSERARVWRFVAGAAPFALMLGAYQWAAFGSPTEFSYAHSSFTQTAQEKGLEPYRLPFLENSARVFFGERGLLIVSPIVLMAVMGMVVVLRQREPAHDRVALIAAAASAASLLAVQMAWSNPTGGDSPGPRYATAGIAFLTPGLAIAAKRWPVATRVTGAVGGVVMLAATWTDPLDTSPTESAIHLWLDRFLTGDWSNTLFEMVAGPGAAILWPILAVAAVWVLVRADRGSSEPVASAPRVAPASEPTVAT